MNVEYTKLTVPGIKRKYVFYHISDCHVVYAAEEDSQADKTLAEKHTEKWSIDGVKPIDAFNEALELVNGNECDGLFITGDCADYYRPSVADYIKRRINECNKEVLFTYGNHEGADYSRKTDHRLAYPDYAPVMHSNPSYWVKDYGDLLVLGFDNSTKEITCEQMDFLEKQCSRGLPVLLLIHVPIDSDKVRIAVEKRWGSDIQQKKYFIMGFDSQSTPESGMKFAEFVKSAENIAAIFAGHIHHAHSGEISRGKMQYTAAPTAAKYIRRIELTPIN